VSGAEDAARSVHAAMVHTLNINLLSVMRFHNIRADLASNGGNWADQVSGRRLFTDLAAGAMGYAPWSCARHSL